MLKLNIPDMTCSHCAGVITKAIKSVDGTAHVNVDYGTRTVIVETVASAVAISRAVDEAGYPNTAH